MSIESLRDLPDAEADLDAPLGSLTLFIFGC